MQAGAGKYSFRKVSHRDDESVSQSFDVYQALLLSLINTI